MIESPRLRRLVDGPAAGGLPPYVFAPSIFTKPLAEDFVSDGPKLRKLVALVWRTPELGITPFCLDRWQADLIDHVLERYPDDHPDPDLAGKLRYRQVVVSIPRQNGKSVLGAIFALYGLMLHEPGPLVIGVASSAEQARIVYNRVLFVIQGSPQLKRRFAKTTETRGIKTADGSGLYEVKASKGAALQGLPVSMGIFDELHISKPDLWQALVNGSVTRRDGMILGITTAGDEQSELLIELYKLGEKAAGGDTSLERFGFFCWQAPESRVPEDDDELAAFLLEANPSLREGRIPLSNVIADVRAMPEADVIRYRLNRFTASAATFIPIEAWKRNVTAPEWPAGKPPIFTIDRTPDWGYAAITATTKLDDGRTYSELVASIVRPTLEQLAAICVDLYGRVPIVFGVDGWGLRDLGKELERRGLPVHIASQSDMLNASALLYSKVVQGKLIHPGDELLAVQLPRTIRKNVGDGFRISRRDSSVEIDGVIATALGVLLAETRRETEIQIF